MLLGVFLCVRITGQLAYPAPASISAFQPDPAVSLRTPSIADSRRRFHPPESFSPPSEFDDLRPAPRIPEDLATFRTTRERLPWGFVPHRGISWQRPHTPGKSQPGLSSVLGVSHALDGLLRHQPCGFISPRSHVQGLPFRGFSLSAEPYRVSPAVSCPLAVGRIRL